MQKMMTNNQQKTNNNRRFTYPQTNNNLTPSSSSERFKSDCESRHGLTETAIRGRKLFDSRLEVVRAQLDRLMPSDMNLNFNQPANVLQKSKSLFDKVPWDNIVDDFNQSP